MKIIKNLGVIEEQIPFDIKEIEKYIKNEDYIKDADEYIKYELEFLTNVEKTQYTTELYSLIYNHNQQVMNDDLKDFVNFEVKYPNHYRNWTPTKEQLIEAINKYYE